MTNQVTNGGPSHNRRITAMLNRSEVHPDLLPPEFLCAKAEALADDLTALIPLAINVAQDLAAFFDQISEREVLSDEMVAAYDEWLHLSKFDGISQGLGQLMEAAQMPYVDGGAAKAVAEAVPMLAFYAPEVEEAGR